MNNNKTRICDKHFRSYQYHYHTHLIQTLIVHGFEEWHHVTNTRITQRHDAHTHTHTHTCMYTCTHARTHDQSNQGAQTADGIKHVTLHNSDRTIKLKIMTTAVPEERRLIFILRLS